MKKLFAILFAVHCSLFTIHRAEAQTIRIPADYPTIQQGIDAADPGDTVLVADGLYFENLDFHGKKPLMVASEFLTDGDTNHINNTIIDGSQPVNPDVGSVVYFHTDEDTTSVLCGFTLTGGTGTIEPSIDFRMGGGVQISFCGAKLIHNHIENNHIVYNGGVYGGGVQAGGPIGEIPWVIMSNNKISNNTATSTDNEGSGGGADIFYNIIMTGNEISNNTVNAPLRCSGGGVEIMGAFNTIEINVRNNRILHNNVISESQLSEYAITGGLSIAWRITGIVSGNEISFNKVISSDNIWGQGAGVLVQDAAGDDFVFENNFITNNTHQGALCLGGGMLLYDTGGKFQNNIIRENDGTYGGGITIQDCADIVPALINNTVTRNTASSLGGGLYVLNSEAVVINTIIWGNNAPNGGSIYEEGSTLTVSYSDVEGDEAWPGDGNENIEPGFGDDGYHLGDASPLWNGGIAATVINGITYECPETDIDGEPMPWGFTDPEIGADETPSSYVGMEESLVVGRGSLVTCSPNPTGGNVDFRLSIPHPPLADSGQVVDGQWSMVNGQCISLNVYNAQGQEVATLFDGRWPAGEVLRWDASRFPAGIYYYRLSTVNRQLPTETGKIVKY